MNKKRLIIVGVIVLAVVAVIIGLIFWKTRPAADVPAPEASPTAPVAENAAVTFASGLKSGTATQEVVVGQNVAAITVNFDYDLQGDAKVITNIGPATAEKISGWYSVARAATIDQDKVIYAQDGAQVTVPVTYQASVGAGYADYDYAVVIDLSGA